MMAQENNRLESVCDRESYVYLSAIVPVSRMSDFGSEISKWVLEAATLGIQIILVHDLSHESSGDFLQELARDYPQRISYCEGVFGNPGAARNRGIQEARGTWICFWDADDRPFPSTYLEMIMRADHENMSFAIGQYQEIDFKTKAVTLNSLGSIGNPLTWYRLAKNPGIWRFAFKSNVMDALSFPPCEMGEDQVFILMCNITKKETLLFQKCVYRYTRNFPRQLTQKNDRFESLQFLFRNHLITSAMLLENPAPLGRLIVARIWISLVKNGRGQDQRENLVLFLKFQVKYLRLKIEQNRLFSR